MHIHIYLLPQLHKQLKAAPKTSNLKIKHYNTHIRTYIWPFIHFTLTQVKLRMHLYTYMYVVVRLIVPTYTMQAYSDKCTPIVHTYIHTYTNKHVCACKRFLCILP